MRTTWSLRQLSRAFVCACAALVLAATAAQGTELHPYVGKLPGYPAMRGVVPVLGSSAAVVAHEKVVHDAFAAAGTRLAKGLGASAEANAGLVAPCVDEAVYFTTQDVCYRGGPVLHDPTIHLIFWQGPIEAGKSKEAGVELFPSDYAELVERYFEGLSHDSGLTTNTFSVDPQYGEETAGKYAPGEYAMKFEAATDVTIDTTTPFPAKPGCSDESKYSNGPCLLDSDIQEEAQRVAKTSEAGLHDIYVVLTPPGIGGCFEESSGECAYKQYCAYHADFGGNGVTPGEQTLYADLPFVGKVEGCDFEVHPNSWTDDGADAVIDDASHEVNETITDPIGSQCESGALHYSECERNAWTDVVGQEIADKCLPPESTVVGTYGGALGEVDEDEERAYNQLIDAEPYWTQRVWSNEAGLAEGGCVQRMIGVSFSVSGSAAADTPIVFDGASSGAPGDPAVYWVWNFEGEQVGTSSVTTSHEYAAPGTYEVGLTAYDAYGNARATVESATVGAAPVLQPPVTPPPPTVVKETPTHYIAAQVAQKLGLPANKATLAAGAGTIMLGHAVCPPTCSVVIKLYTSVRTTIKHRRVVKLVLIGSLSATVAVNGSRTLALSLNATGLKLLRQEHKLVAQLSVTVTGQEGGTWPISRTLTLTSKR